MKDPNKEIELAAEAGIVIFPAGGGKWLIWRPKEKTYYQDNDGNGSWYDQHMTKFESHAAAVNKLPAARAAIRRKAEDDAQARDVIALARQIHYLATWESRCDLDEMNEQLEAIAKVCLQYKGVG